MSSSRDIRRWLDEVERFIKLVEPAINAIADRARIQRRLNQVFQCYVYALTAYAAHVERYSLTPRNLDPSNAFVFKLGAGRGYGRSSRFSYFIIDIDGKGMMLLNNILVSVYSNSLLSLDVAIVRGTTPSDYMNRENVAFFAECKSLNSASSQLIATVLGQNFLVKRRICVERMRICRDHPYQDIPDLLVVRGTASPSLRNIAARTRNWSRLPIDIVDRVNPYGPNSGMYGTDSNTYIERVRNILSRIARSTSTL